MKYLDKIENIQDTYLAYGSFESMHKGHISVLRELAGRGRKDGKKTVVISCWRPSEITDGVITTEEEKAYFAEKEGVDYFISCNLDKENMTEQELIQKAITDLGAKLIVTAENHSDVSLFKDRCEVGTVRSVSYNGEVLNSTLVRKYFMDCRFEEVTQMCGHTFIMIGEVVHGKALGRTVGMPTANLGVTDTKLRPPSGVYATRTMIGEEVYQGLTNIGTRPSVDSLPVITIETFLLNFSKDIYGKKLIMEVHLYIRGVQKFGNLEEVQNQVQKDLAQVKEYLNSLS